MIYDFVVSFSNEMKKNCDIIKKFLFDKVYNHSHLSDKRQYSKKVISTLFTYFVKNNNKLIDWRNQNIEIERLMKRPKWFPFNILIHKMLDDDHGEGVHNHLCPYITIILKGGYWETTKKGKFWRPPGYIGFRSADHLHRVDLKPNTNTMTLFIPGPFGFRKTKRADYKTKI